MRRLAPTGPDLSDDRLAALRRPPVRPDGRPWVRMAFISSADGSAALDGASGGLGSPADQRQFQLARRDADVILVGAGTVRAEGYEGALLSPQAQAWRVADGRPPHPPVAVVSGRLDLAPDAGVLRDAPVRPWILTTAASLAATPDLAAALHTRADVVAVGEDDVDPHVLVRALADRGARVVHGEGGPGLFGTLAAAGLVDELLLTVSPLLAGGDGPRILTGGAGPGLPAGLRLDLAVQDGSMLFLRYLHERHAEAGTP